MNIHPAEISHVNPLPEPRNSYLVYVVFELPKLNHDEHIDKAFLLSCLESIQKRNNTHLNDGIARSYEYFTSLNHSQRYRVPKALNRLNLNDPESKYGILAFHAFRDEPVKNKAFNQRVASINPDILVVERLAELFAPLDYRADFSSLGQVVEHISPAFVQVSLDTSLDLP